jgi:hypothetical protein
MDEQGFNVGRILDALIADVMSPKTGSETDKAMADALVRGAGYLRFTTSGVQHVPFDDVRISHSAGEPR